jgi:hypothetical protein
MTKLKVLLNCLWAVYIYMYIYIIITRHICSSIHILCSSLNEIGQVWFEEEISQGCTQSLQIVVSRDDVFSFEHVKLQRVCYDMFYGRPLLGTVQPHTNAHTQPP